MMTLRTAAFVLALAAAGPALAQDAPAPPAEEQIQKVQDDVSRMRGLPFRAPVVVGVQEPDVLRAMLLEDFEKEAPVEELMQQSKVLEVFGLLPQGFDLRGKLLEFLGDQIGGFYDPEKKRLFLIDRSGEGPLDAMTQQMNDRMVLAHELHHALQDQHFGLDRWFEVLGDHEDRLAAYKALVEGEAQIVGMNYVTGREVDIRALNRMQEMMMKVSPEAAKLRALPPYLVEGMMFPYTEGAEFVQALKKARGWEGVSAAFNDPPSSTEQVLHPEKYFGERDEPSELRMPVDGMKKVISEDAKELYQNTLGEYGMVHVLKARGQSKAEASKAAAGWDGDRFVGFEAPDGRVVLVWLSTWDEEREAEEFRVAVTKAWGQKADVQIERRGTEVVLVDGATAAEQPGLIGRAFRSLKVEERLQPLPALVATPSPAELRGDGPIDGGAGAGARNQAEPQRAERVARPAAQGPRLVRVEALGATLLVPADYKVSSKSNTGGVEGAVTFTRGGGDGGFVELEWLGQPLQAAESTIAARVRQHMKGGELTQRLKTPERFGRPAQAIAYRLGRNSSPDALEVHAVLLDLGPKTLVVSASGPQAERVLEQALSSLWLDDHGPLREGRSATPERWINADLGVSLSMPVVLDESTTEGQGPILAKQRGADGAKVVVIAVPAGGDLAAAGRRLEAQVPLLGDGAQLRTAGLVERSGRTVHEMETVVAGRRTRQTTWIAGDLRVTVAVSAPEASFDRLRPEFGRVLAETKASAVTPR